MFASVMAALAALPDAAMEETWFWREGGRPLQRRDQLYHALEDEQRLLVEASGHDGHPEAALILSLANRALGDLSGLLAGASEEVLDALPTAGQWSLRQVLAHVFEVELSYRANTLYALTRDAADPLPLPASLRPKPGEADVTGGAGEILARIASARDQTDADLLGRFAVTAGDPYSRSSTWVEYEVDVRFRLHRFASHYVEHTIQCEKTLHSMGQDPGEARQVVRAIWATRGAHRSWTPDERLQELDLALARAAGTAT